MENIFDMIERLCPDGVEYVKLKNICEISRGKAISKDYIKDNSGDFPVYSSQTKNNGELGKISTYMFDGNYITWTTDGLYAGTVFYRTGKFNITSVCGLLKVKNKNADVKFVYYALQTRTMRYVNKGMGNHKLMSNIIAEISIPLPPLEIQQKIVNIFDSFTELTELSEHEAELRQKQYKYYLDRLLTFGDDVEYKTLGEIGKVLTCRRIMKSQTNSKSGVSFFTIGTLGKKADSYISTELYNEYKQKYSYPKKSDVLISASGTIGRTVIFDGNPAYFQDSNIVWIDNDETIVSNKYLYYFYQTNPWKISEGSTIARLYNDDLAKIKIPVPPTEEQKRIVNILDIFSELTELSKRENELRQKQYKYYRNILLDFDVHNRGAKCLTKIR